MENYPKASLVGVMHTHLPDDIINTIRTECRQYDTQTRQAATFNKNDTTYRKTLIKSISSYEWFAGMLWHYISRANRENYLYDITCIENESLNYLIYPPGHYYRWHQDQAITSCLRPTILPSVHSSTIQQSLHVEHQWIRKISFSLQLSSPDEYTGGELQFHNNNYGKEGIITAPKEKGSLILFDSRLSHRVTKVKEGTRESLVGWVLGARWK